VNTWKVILATMVIFGAGVVTGGLLVGHADRLRPQRPVQREASTPVRTGLPLSPNVLKLELLRRVERELDLQPEQREHVAKILSASQERTRKLMDPVTPLVREEVQRTKDEFRAVLTPDQQKRFDEMLKQPKLPRDPREQRRPGMLPPHDRFPEGAGYPPSSNEPANP
jgi:hypothetical protein